MIKVLTLAKRLGKSLRTTQRYLKILSEKKQIAFQGVAKKRRVCGGVNMANGGAKSTIWRCKYCDSGVITYKQ